MYSLVTDDTIPDKITNNKTASKALRIPNASPSIPKNGGPTKNAVKPIIETVATLEVAFSPLSPAAERPIGKPSAAPIPTVLHQALENMSYSQI